MPPKVLAGAAPVAGAEPRRAAAEETGSVREITRSVSLRPLDGNASKLLTSFTCAASEAVRTHASEIINEVVAATVVSARRARTLVDICEQRRW